jgi:hypothetical protein
MFNQSVTQLARFSHDSLTGDSADLQLAHGEEICAAFRRFCRNVDTARLLFWIGESRRGDDVKPP